MTIPPAEALVLQSLVATPEQGIASRVLAKTSGGNMTLFAFDSGQGLSEHTSPFEAFALVLEGSPLNIGGRASAHASHQQTSAARHVPHALEADEPQLSGDAQGTRSGLR